MESCAGADGRCGWAHGSDAMGSYHDDEWGVPSRDERHLFEMLVLEGAQAGLSWSTILNKRSSYRAAFAQFDVDAVARFGEERIAELLENPGIVRNRLKVRSAVQNARATIAVADEFGSFGAFIWAFVDGTPIVNHPGSMAELPARTELSDTVSRELKGRGFNFVGSTIVYSYLQSIGIVDDHVVGCPAKASG